MTACAAETPAGKTPAAATANEAVDRFAGPIEAGEPVLYDPFYPDRWSERGVAPRLVPWSAQHVAFLTTNAAFDPSVMGPLVRRLDAGWALYADLTGSQPSPLKQVSGLTTVAAVPSPDFTCGYGCGYVGATGVEVGGFYAHDYPLLERDRKAVPHYYFYELGRNFYTFGDRHSLFTTGYAVFMRYVCLDTLECPDPDVATRRIIESAIGCYESNKLGFLEAFTTVTGRDEKAHRLVDAQGQTLVPSDQPVVYASAMLRLRRECGGNEWLKRFYRQLATCPEVDPESAAAGMRQSLSWLVAAACAAHRDLTPLFADRWRLPLDGDTRRRLSLVDWSDPELSAAAVLARLDRPPGLAVGPYVQPLSPEAVVVRWQTDQPAYSWLEYGVTEALGQRRDTVVHGLRLANVREHRATLEGLEPGASYYYRVAFKPIRKFEPYKVDFAPEERSEIATFRTLSGPGAPVAMAIFNDLHNLPGTFRRLRQALGDTPFDCSLFNGDCFTDPSTVTDVLGPLAAYTAGVQAGSRPVLFVRGNHEVRGAFARDLPRLLAWPDDRPYFAFNAGPVRFLVLDCGEDKPDTNKEYSGLVDFVAFRKEQTEWLRKELGSPAFTNATWRVLISHAPLHTIAACQSAWGEMLARADIDLAIHGHTHRAVFHPPGAVGNPYPAAVGGAPRVEAATVMLLNADTQRLRLRVLSAEGREVYPPFEKRR